VRTLIEESSAADGDRLKRALLAIRALRAQVDELERARTAPIAIVGMACRFPGGASDPDRYWEMLRTGVDGVVEIPSSRMSLDHLYDPDADPETSAKIYTRRAGLLPDVERFDAGFFRISPREALSLDPQHRLALEVTWTALERAAIAPSRLHGSKSGVILGVTLTDYDHGIRLGGPQNIDTYHLSGNCLNFAAGRIAYLLGLHGPTLVLDSACSSSLVAIHLACQSLRTREADLMIAGGVNVILSPDGTLMVCKMRMVSAEGRCATFDASADGFVRGEGCGVVVLKRLDDALRDQDPIVALIRASAINQDGASSGLTVPNGLAQQALIREVLARAGLTADDVGYLECHGTGTALGDPIEVEALGEALARTRARGPLRIGSVKTNFGHLESASGVAGLMKAALVVQKGAIPPHLHLREVNPNLSLRDGNLAIPTELTPWPADAPTPRIAGVSSFGASGTNAHALLQEPPAPAPRAAPESDTGRSELLCLSARTPTALQELAGRWATALSGDAPLADLCCTAGVGRDHFEHRLALIGTERASFAERLTAVARGASTADVERGELSEKRRDVVFLFPGQGAQYPGMGRELHREVPAFRAALEECRIHLDPLLERPLLELLDYGSEAGAPAASAVERLAQTRNTQPAIFAIEYALAQTWRALGVEPAVMLGHSVGEFVAATLSGVLRLEDACRLVAARGRLMAERCTPGAMAAVFADEKATGELIAGLAAEVGIAAVNGPSSVVVSGSERGVATVVERAGARGVKTKRLTVSHAFHSPLMEPVLAEFRALAAAQRFGVPKIPLLSNLTGGELTAAQAADPDYWCRHLREPVRFADSLRWLLERNHKVFLEVGPGSTLLGLAQQTIPATGRAWVASLRQGKPEWPQLLQAVASLYVGGATPDFTRFFQGRDARRIVAPTYPFEGKRYRKGGEPPSAPAADTSEVVRSLEGGDPQALTRLVEAGAGWSRTESDLFAQFAARIIERHQKSRASTHASLLHEVEWRARARAAAAAPPAPAGTWLLLADGGGVAESVARELERRGETAIVARPGPALSIAGRAWTFDPASAEHCGALVAALGRNDGSARARGIVDLLGLDFRTTAATTVATLAEDHERGLLSLLSLAQALPENDPAAPPLWIVTRGAASADAARHGMNVAAAALWGFGRAYALERPDKWGGLLDLDPAGDRAEAGPLVDELLSGDGEDQVAWRGHQRFVPRLVVATGVALAPVAVAPDRTYLVAGGFGQAGGRFVRRLVERGARHFVLVGRSGAATPAAQELLRSLKDAGVEVRAVAADVSDPEQMRRVEEALAQGPPLGGVVQAAGIARFERIAATRPEDFRAVLAAKVRGTWLLHELTKSRPVDLFVGFSSIASVWGSAGQVHSSAANRFQDAIAFARRHLGLAATTVSFSPWKGGSAPSEEFNRFMASLGVTPIDPAEGLPELEAALASGRAHVVLAKVEWGLFRSVMEARRRRPLFEELAVAAPSQHPEARPAVGDLRGELAAAPPAERAERLAAHLQDQLGELMGFGAERPDPQRGFIELGVDSLMAVTLRDRLQTSLGVELPVTFIFDHPTIEVLAEHLLANVLVLAKEARPAAPEVPAAPSSRDTLMNEARELSQDQLEQAIAQQLKDLGLH